MVYTTTKAVAQIQASRLSSDPFISFIEAKLESHTVPATYAYLKVVDGSGLRDLGFSDSLVPNRSLYLGGDLIIRINKDETELRVYDIRT